MRRLAAVLAIGLLACEPERPPKTGLKPPCPPPPEPDHVAVVVGTIGKLHLVESQYALPRLGDVLAAFKPDLVLVQVRVDPYKDNRLEDASFEMTYATWLAKQHGVAVEPIDWFREEDLAAPPPPVEPWDAAELARRETEILAQPPLFTFEQANAQETTQRVLGAELADRRFRGGDAVASRRRAWIEDLAISAVTRHARPKRVLAYVGVLDRPAATEALTGAGYFAKDPIDLVEKAKEKMVGDLSGDLVEEYKSQLARLRSADKSNARVAEHAKVLEVVVEKRGACCVPQSSLRP
ncbi:MAG TPA: hypothetical protein VIF62_13195 [Labilithrix sp.]